LGQKFGAAFLPYAVVSGCAFVILSVSYFLPTSLRYPRDTVANCGIELEVTVETKLALIKK
jgi:hypothetical protein